VEISCRVYKPRRPRESPLYRLVEQHLEELLQSWPARFVRQHGPLRPVVERVLREFLKCGLLEHGFARLWCGECRRSVLVAFSCRGRSFCPSCEKKKQLLWAEWLREELLLPVAHRHVVLTIPRLLRPLFRRRRELLGELARAGAEAVKELVRHASGEGDARPGVVVSVATAGDLLHWHPHLHLITTAGGRAPDGSWHALSQWDSLRLMTLFRERLLACLLDKRAISEDLVTKLLAWRHPGFSAHVGDRVAAEDKKRLEDTAAYLVRHPLSLKKLVYLDGHKAVLYRSRMNPALGRNFEAMDPLEWLARISDHIPDPGQHRTLFYGEYSSRARAGLKPLEPDATSTTADQPPPRRRCPPSWARLIANVYQVDPLVCTRCGRRMSILAFVSDQHSISRILEHLGLRSPQLDRPPPARAIHEIIRVAEQGEGWGVPASWD
jgi:Transposase zinc-binding domain/Putative transposase